MPEATNILQILRLTALPSCPWIRPIQSSNLFSISIQRIAFVYMPLVLIHSV